MSPTVIVFDLRTEREITIKQSRKIQFEKGTRQELSEWDGHWILYKIARTRKKTSSTRDEKQCDLSGATKYLHSTPCINDSRFDDTSRMISPTD